MPQLVANDRKLDVGQLIGKPLIRQYDPSLAVPIVALAIKKAEQSFSTGKKMNPDQVATLAYDILDIMPYESLEDVILMFKLFRQGKLTQDPMNPFRAFDSFNITKVLIPAYLKFSGDRKAEIREREHQRIKSEGTTDTLEAINGLFPGLGSTDVFKVPEIAQEEVTEAFKVMIDQLDYSELIDAESRYKYIERLKDKRSYITRRRIEITPISSKSKEIATGNEELP